MHLVEATVTEVVVVCLFCGEPLDEPDDIWCPGCDGGDEPGQAALHPPERLPGRAPDRAPARRAA